MARRPFLKLRRLIEDEGYDLKDVYEMTGITRSTMYNRIGAPETDASWCWSEIVLICKALNIPQEKIGEYFFPSVEKGDKSA